MIFVGSLNFEGKFRTESESNCSVNLFQRKLWYRPYLTAI